MAAPGGKFFIQDQLDDVAPHHESFKQLWETKWKKPVSSPLPANWVVLVKAGIANESLCSSAQWEFILSCSPQFRISSL